MKWEELAAIFQTWVQFPAKTKHISFMNKYGTLGIISQCLGDYVTVVSTTIHLRKVVPNNGG